MAALALWLALWSPALRAGPAPAVAAAPEPEPERVAAIVVTARGAKQKAFEADRAVERVTPDDVATRQARSLPEVLSETTGAFVQMTNRGAGAPILRGLVGPQNLILVDGVRYNNATFRTGPNQYLALLDLSAVAGVEVLLGPGSVLYGSDAMGGVINVGTVGWAPPLGWGGRAGARFASADRATAVWGDVSWESPAVHVLAGGAFRHFDTLRTGGGAEEPLSDYTQGAWHARARWEPLEDLAVGVTYLGARIRDAGRTDRLYEGRVNYADNDDDFLYAEAEWAPGGVLRELRAVAAFHRTWEEGDAYRCDLPEGAAGSAVAPCLGLAGAVREWGRGAAPGGPLTRQDVTTDEVLSPGGLVTADLSFWDNRIRATVGADAWFDHVQSSAEGRRADTDPAWAWEEAARGNFSDGSTYLTTGGFALVEGDLLPVGPHRLVAGLGGRVAHFRAAAPDVPGMGDVDYDHTGFAGSASLRYLLEDSFMTWATWVQGFRAPNLQETTVLGDTGSKFEVPNADLGPERNDTFELGARLALSPVQVRLAGFYSLMDDVIDEQELAPEEWAALGSDPALVGDKPVIRRVNSSSGWYAGVEASLSAGPFHGLRPWAQVAWLRGEIDQGDRTVPARRVPPLNGAFGLRYEHPDDGWYVEIFSLWAARQDRLHPSDETDLRICGNPATPGDTFAHSDLPCRGTPGWVTLNFRGGFRVEDLLRVDIAVLNATDADYRYHGSGVDAPGAGVTVTAEGTF